jgi:uncharacterized protein
MKLITLLATSLCLSAAAFAAPAIGSSPTVADAVQRRETASLQSLIKAHADVNLAQPDGTSALHWAAHWNDLDTVKLLLQSKADAKAVNRYGATPLSEAVVASAISPQAAAMIEILLKAGADPKSLTTPDGETVLMTASHAGNVEAVRLLLDAGADVNGKESYRGQTALMLAAAEGHSAIVKLLMDHHADWKVVSKDRPSKMPKISFASAVTPIARGGMTALLFAAREGNVESAKAMLDGGVDVNQLGIDENTALTVAIMNKHYTFAKYLLDRGADPNIADVKGRTALYAALDARTENWTALPPRKEQDPLSSLALIEAILAHGADPNKALTKMLDGKSGMDFGDFVLGAGTTPLMRAAVAGDVPSMRLLLAKGADIKRTTPQGNSALLFAAGVGYRDKYTRGTEAEALDALKLTLEHGQDLHQANAAGETALHGAASRGADTIVQFLVDHGANVNATTARAGHTPLDIAMGKAVTSQLPVPYDSTVALIKKLGGREGEPKIATVAQPAAQ